MISKKINNILIKSQEFDSNNKELIKKQGVVFTTNNVCKKIINKIEPKITDIICEPSVGKGVFVFNLLEYFRLNGHNIDDLAYFVSNKLYCYDINKDFILIFKNLLVEYFNILDYKNKLKFNNIMVADFLLTNKKYDTIIGNPPYVRIQNLETTYINKLKGNNIKSIDNGNIDLYYAFVEKSLLCANNIGFIIPNTFIKNKTGKSLRKILNDRIYEIYDFENNKVWNNISTYTSIIFCNNKKNDVLKYITDNNYLNLKKNNGEWFKNNTTGEINNIVKNITGGIATLRDNIYKFNYSDNNYVYKNNGEIKIEKSICKKVYKATTKEYFWFIYPYDNKNNIINENKFKLDYPLAYKYLLNNKEELLKRDNGNLEKQIKYGEWYGYGRKQGMLKCTDNDDVELIIPLTFLKDKMHHIIENNILILSGIKITLRKNNLNNLLDILYSSKFQNYLQSHNKLLHDNDKTKIWLTVNTTSLKNY